ncbi:MAG: TspO/MBR family protein [Sphaerimonospora mesophila]
MVKKIAIYVGSILVSLTAGAIGSLATVPNIPSWYEPLVKPPLLPPNEIFGPVWIVLYILMGIALALLIVHDDVQQSKKISAYAWFGAQLTLNTLWSITFFGLHLPTTAVVVILALIGAIIMTMITFRRFVPATILLFAPYLAWVCFATYLNLGVAILN